jgi:hypothetical protein
MKAEEDRKEALRIQIDEKKKKKAQEDTHLE